MGKKNILVVDDSALMRRVMCDIINADSNFQAIDFCKDGLEAYEKLKKTSYDGVVLDVNMPRMDGLELLTKLKEDKIKANVIMVSTLTSKDAEITLMALERGAIDFVTKPDNIVEAKGDEFKKQVLSVLEAVLVSKEKTVKPATVRAQEEIKAVASRPAEKPAGFSPLSASVAGSRNTPIPKKMKATGGKQIIALACSTGGPAALQQVIPKIHRGLGCPIVLVQHMPVGFTRTLAERLDGMSELTVTEAKQGDVLENDHVYIAPGGQHLTVVKHRDGTHGIAFCDMPPIGGLKPCANLMFDSLGESGYDEVVCVVLTGMGADGTNGILSLCKEKPIYVISQDAETCVVYGMPKAIADTGLCDEVVPLGEVAETIMKKVGVKQNGCKPVS